MKNGLLENFFCFGSFAGLRRDYDYFYLFLVNVFYLLSFFAQLLELRDSVKVLTTLDILK